MNYLSFREQLPQLVVVEPGELRGVAAVECAHEGDELGYVYIAQVALFKLVKLELPKRLVLLTHSVVSPARRM